MLRNSDTGPFPLLETKEARQDSMTSQFGVYGMPDGTFKDAWGNVVDDPDFSVEESEDGSTPETTAKSLDEMTAQELKDEAKARQDAGRELDLSSVKNKADLIAVLKADDQANAPTPGA